MPVRSKAQLRLMEAAAHGKSTSGISPKVAKEFIGKTTKGEFKNLPEKVKDKASAKAGSRKVAIKRKAGY